MTSQPRRHTPRGWLKLSLWWALVMGLAAPAGAAELPQGGWRELAVGVLPVQYLGREGADLFDERAGIRPARELAGHWQRVIEGSLMGREQLKVMPVSQLRETLSHRRDYRRTGLLAERYAELGVSRYHDLQASEALGDFDRALELYREVYADIADPDVVADASLYRGLILAEQGEPGRAHVAFRDALLLDPSRRFDPGYYPPAVEKALMGAQADIVGRADKLAARYPSDRLLGVARLLQLDVLIAALVDGPPEAPVLELAIYDRRAHGITRAERISLRPPGVAQDRLDRLISAWSTCAVEAERRARFQPPPRKRWFVDLTYVHGVWLSHRRTRDLLQSVGGQVALTYEPSSILQVYLRTMQLVTLSDANADLLDVFVTARLAAGAGLTFGPPSLRFFARAGFQLGVSASDIHMTTDVDCKYFGADHPRCGDVFTANAPAVWFGIEFSLGARIALSRGWYVAISSGLSSYVLDPEVTGDLNFPWYGSAGFGAAF